MCHSPEQSQVPEVEEELYVVEVSWSCADSIGGTATERPSSGKEKSDDTAEIRLVFCRAVTSSLHKMTDSREVFIARIYVQSTLSKPDSKFGPLPAELHLYLCN